jgi:hypothetical protein
MTTPNNPQQSSSAQAWSGRGKLSQLVAELERQTTAKADFVADTRSLKVEATEAGGLVLKAKDRAAGEWLPQPAPIRPAALLQFGEKAEPGIPGMFLKRLAETRPQRAAELLNGLMNDGPARRFVRVLDGNVRGFLSDRFRVLDHFDIAAAALQSAKEAGAVPLEAALSETGMRLKLTTPHLWETITQARKEGKAIKTGMLGSREYLEAVGFRMGDDMPGGGGTVYPLVTVSNSETGHGGFSVQLGIFEGACANGMIFEKAVAQVHLGERQQVGIFTEQTIAVESKAIFLKARDAVAAAFKRDTFAALVNRCREAQAQPIRAPQSAVENVAKAAGLSDKGREALLSYFLGDYDMTRFGLAQAVARAAQDLPQLDDAAALEAVAGKVAAGEVALT